LSVPQSLHQSRHLQLLSRPRTCCLPLSITPSWIQTGHGVRVSSHPCTT
jgi:hypothetical protein